MYTVPGTLTFYILSSPMCVSYPIMRLSYPIVSGFSFILSWKPFIGFCIYRVSSFGFIRLSVYRVNRNTSAFSWTNKKKIPNIFYILLLLLVIKYCGFLFAVTICICFLKLKVYQYYFRFNSINRLLTAIFYLDCTYADCAKGTFQYVGFEIDALLS